MMLLLQGVLEAEDVERVRKELEAADWQDGRATAGRNAREVKNNLQLTGQEALTAFVSEALHRHSIFKNAAHPKALSKILLSKYEPGMTYGPHIDNAIMGKAGPRIRADLAFTIFLVEPNTYEGGELTIETPIGPQKVKLRAGDAILYPAGSIHHVTPVTKGVRYAAVGWVQSQIRDAGQREIIFDLGLARARLQEAGASRDNLLLIDKAASNLLRMWADL
ncbi:MAG: Fe2+-dependent dioxygenase [Hyphomonadaceae bacterium]